MRPMQRTATGDLRRLREDLRAKLSRLGQRSFAIDSVPPNGKAEPFVISMRQASPGLLVRDDGDTERWDHDHPANRLVSSLTRPARVSDCTETGRIAVAWTLSWAIVRNAYRHPASDGALPYVAGTPAVWL